MPKFICSYAHDISCFADFVVEAKSEAAAFRKIKKALRDGKFENVDTTPAWENGSSNERVFVQGPADEHSHYSTMEEVAGESKNPVQPTRED
jgi:aspartyl aminopeptidase